MSLARLLVSGLLFALLSPAQVRFEKSQGQIQIEIDGKPFSTFYFGPEAPKPYLHPLRAPDGTIVTRRFPMEDIEGERKDHPHHRGLWFTHGDVSGYDFWANEPTQEGLSKGRISLRKIKTEADGSIKAVFEWKTAEGKALLIEDRTMTFRSQRTRNEIDFDITLVPASEAVVFGDTKEGTFAIRIAAPLEESAEDGQGVARTGKIVSADGRGGEGEVWGSRSQWVDYSGLIKGKKLGIAIFDHPENPKHPTYWHVRGYGLFAANIFGEHDFHRDDSRDGSITLAPGESLRFRYRVSIHHGDTRGANIAQQYREYTEGKVHSSSRPD